MGSKEHHGQSGHAGSKTMEVLQALREVQAPGGRNIIAEGLVKNLMIQGQTVRFGLAIEDEAVREQVAAQARQALNDLGWVEEIQIEAQITDGQPKDAVPPAAKPKVPTEPDVLLPNVAHVVAIGSGKGGVGKSTISVNLALALAGEGLRVGILDADVYGPSVPLMLGLTGQPMVSADEKLLPLTKHDLKVMSMGLLLRPDQAVVWRGPMVHGAVKQFLGDVDWGELDFLIVDLPPGTGDAPLSLAQALPLTAAVVVTTPQQVAASVAQKAMSMFDRMGIRILGLIENMSYFICPHCEKRSDIFDVGGGKRLAQERGVPLLGEIPLDIRMRSGGDVGEPVVVQYPESELAQRFREVAGQLADQLG